LEAQRQKPIPAPHPEELRIQAFESLDQAEAICKNSTHAQVLDRVYYFRACWHLQLTKYQLAKRDADSAFRVAQRVADHVIMAHVKLLLCKCKMLEHDNVEARRLAAEALDEANKTDNRRVRARALIWMGLVEAGRNTTAAREYLEQSKAWIRASDQDYLRWEFESLEASANKPIHGESSIDLSWVTHDIILKEGVYVIVNRTTQTIWDSLLKRFGTISGTAKELRVGRSAVKRNISTKARDSHLQRTTRVKH
jgi:hypothetical protein